MRGPPASGSRNLGPPSQQGGGFFGPVSRPELRTRPHSVLSVSWLTISQPDLALDPFRQLEARGRDERAQCTGAGRLFNISCRSMRVDTFEQSKRADLAIC